MRQPRRRQHKHLLNREPHRQKRQHQLLRFKVHQRRAKNGVIHAPAVKIAVSQKRKKPKSRRANSAKGSHQTNSIRAKSGLTVRSHIRGKGSKTALRIIVSRRSLRVTTMMKMATRAVARFSASAATT